ncbi:MAG TPA: hypothetical protein PLH32_07525 [bacterium]|nr:hypothetical protein [bacterium]
MTVFLSEKNANYEGTRVANNIKIEYYSNYIQLITKILRAKDNKIFIAGNFDAFILLPIRIFSKKKFILWVQGLHAEEKYLKTKSKLIFFIYSLIQRMAMQLCHRYIFVSTHMREYFEKIYKKSYTDLFIVVPCTSDLHYTSAKKIPSSYTYIGGTSAWQKIDKILQLFNIIGQNNTEAKLFLIMNDISQVYNLIELHAVQKAKSRIIVDHLVERNAIQDHLSKMQYGFLIRDQHIINNVASPIKLAEYLSCGVFPIISPSITSYANLLELRNSALVIRNIEDILLTTSLNINTKELLESYQLIYSEEKLTRQYKFLI